MYVRLVSDSLPKQETLHYLLGTSEPKDETSQEKIYWIGATRCKAPSVQRDPGMLVGRDFFHKSKCPFFDYYISVTSQVRHTYLDTSSISLCSIFSIYLVLFNIFMFLFLCFIFNICLLISVSYLHEIVLSHCGISPIKHHTLIISKHFFTMADLLRRYQSCSNSG